MIKANNLIKKFGDLTAVDNLCLEILKGETFGLLGPNGAGKTTTINMLAGILKPDSGTVTINGKSDPTKSEVRRNLGIAPQSLALYEELTAFENLRFFGQLYDLSGSELNQRVEWALDFVNLSDRKNDRSKVYSGGMQRRLNLACALVHDPPILLLDEPTVGVDPQSRNLIFDKIEQFKTDGRTVVYTTHYMEEAERLCDRVAIIDQGKILAMGTVDELIDTHGGQSTVEVQLSEINEKARNMGGTIEGNWLKINSVEPMQTVNEISNAGLDIKSLKIDRSNLENVFLNLTGRRLRDQ